MTGTDESEWLGWLGIALRQREALPRLEAVAESAKAMKHVVLLGMGGSSLGPEVLAKTFGVQEGRPELLVLDSVVPDQVASVTDAIDPAKTVFLVSSKSGGTAETNSLYRHFRKQLDAALGRQDAGSHFIAITDRGTSLHQLAKDEGFGHIFHGETAIGGRFSVLSNFGLVPAALMGLDVGALLERTGRMVESCAPCVPAELNPGAKLGAAMAVAAKAGRDKLTILTSPGLSTLGLWLEQLIAESTGKRGIGIVPVAGEWLGEVDQYGDDRLFVYARLASDDAAETDAAIDTLREAGQPVIRLEIDDAMDLGQAFFRWEIATAVAGAELGINPFDQPDVEAAKIAARAKLAKFDQEGRLPEEQATYRDGELSLYADAKAADRLSSTAGAQSLEDWVAAHLGSLGSGDYFAIHAYLPMTDANEDHLQAIRHSVRDARRVATTLGYGPRFLHSTGQLHKGGPNSGVFLQITCDDQASLEIPGQRADFGVLKAAQAQGDLEVLSERDRRVLRIHLHGDPTRALQQLREIVVDSLSA